MAVYCTRNEKLIDKANVVEMILDVEKEVRKYLSHGRYRAWCVHMSRRQPKGIVRTHTPKSRTPQNRVPLNI